MISVKNLHKSFGKNHILNNIDFDIQKGECVAVIGPSGSGKSTFLRCINRLEEPTSGEIYYNDELITKKNIYKIRPKIGMVFQHFNLINNLTVLDNLTLAPVKLGLLTNKEAEAKAIRYLRRIELGKKKNVFPASLSGGQQQRIAIIRSLMLDPEILLFDEPTSALDLEMIGEVLSLIREVIQDGMTAIVVTHEINFAKEVASRIVFIDKGKIIEENTPKEFFAHPKSPRVQEFLSKVL